MEFKFKLDNFSLYNTLYSGQCFRFFEIKKNEFLVFAGENSSYIKQDGKVLSFYNSSCDENFWKEYFNFYVDYNRLLDGFKGDSVLERLVKSCCGIRILKQDPFETLISFILSANNNIKRIQKIVETLCRNFGKKNNNGFSFPTVENLSSCSLEDLYVLKAGFRVKYIKDAIEKVTNKYIDLKELNNLEYPIAKEKLKKIKGVGDKVSDCVLLFAYNKMEAFPVDIWIKRVILEYYKDGFSRQVLSCKGLSQQFLFFGKKNGYI